MSNKKKPTNVRKLCEQLGLPLSLIPQAEKSGNAEAFLRKAHADRDEVGGIDGPPAWTPTDAPATLAGDGEPVPEDPPAADGDGRSSQPADTAGDDEGDVANWETEGGAVPPSLPPSIPLTITITLPLLKAPPHAYRSNHVEANRLTPEQAEALKSLTEALMVGQVLQPNGRPIDSPAAALRWLLDTIHQASVDQASVEA